MAATKNFLFLIPVIISIVLVISIGIVGGFLGWKLARTTQELSAFPVEKLSTYPFQNGDLLLFSSSIRNWVHSFDMIHMLMSDSPITHVGIAVQDPYTKLWRCWELALGGNIPELIRLTNLHARVQSYRGTVLVRKLLGAKVPNSEKLYNYIAKILRNQKNNPKRYRASFYLNTYDRFVSFHPPLPMDYRAGTLPKQKEWICTDLVNETYKALDVFQYADYNTWPCDFYSKTEKMPLKEGWCFSKEIRLEKDIKI